MSEARRSPSSGGRTSRRGYCSGLGGRMVVGLVLLALGVLWTLDNLNLIQAASVIQWWPVLLVLLGLSRLTGLSCEPRPISGAVWTIVGAVLLLRPLGILAVEIGDLWPLVLIFFGAAMVHRSWRGRASRRFVTDGQPVMHAFALMGGLGRKVVSQEFRGGDAMAFMGGAVVDLRSARLAKEGATMDVFACFGGVDLVVPEGWKVIGEVVPGMGGFGDNTVLPEAADAPTLHVRGVVVMGGVEVKHHLQREDRSLRMTRRRGSVEKEFSVGSGGIRVRRSRRSDPDD